MVEETDNTAWVPGRLGREAREPAPVGAAPCDRLVRLVGRFAAAVLVLAIALVLLVPTAHWLAHHDIGSARGPLLQAARVAAQGQLLTLGAGLSAAGALLAVADFTLSQRTLKLTEQGQVTRRHTEAIEQLGSDKLDVRIGGIYALERVARDSARHHPAVMEVLTAFVREHSHKPWPPPDSGGREPERWPRPDVQAALTVVGRRDAQRDIQPMDLTGTDLARADLHGANFTRADLGRADLTGANLHGSDLTGANLGRADLTGADLTRANLSRARLFFARLIYARLTRADLGGADLGGADLTCANLHGADLTRANLGRADLTGADFIDARWPEQAAVPGGWRINAGTGRLATADTGYGPAEVN
jgi:Pentapeptide repeats (8 copies)